MFAQIYECPKCGETWNVRREQSIDCENDRVETFLVCVVCGSEVGKEKKTEDGYYHVHLLTEEEMQADMWRDPDDVSDFDTADF